MIHLPNFSEQHPTVDFLRTEQERLVKQADKMMEETGIMDIIANHGNFSGVGGSYKYNLMIYPDLDVGIVAEKVDKQAFVALLSDIASCGYVRKTRSTDTINFKPVKNIDTAPTGYWIGIEIPFENDRWGIDCWLQQPDWVGDGRDAYADRLAELDQDARDGVLAIKYDLIRTKVYGTKYTSAHVYDSVLDGGVRSVDEFYDWVKSSK